MGSGKTLVLLRHARASSAMTNDFDRRLTDDGREQARRTGHKLATAGIRPDILVSSPAARAWETAILAGRALGIEESAIVAEPGIYNADLPQLLQVVAKHGAGHACVMLVGHNPGLTELGMHLSGGEAPDLDKAEALQLACDADWKELRPSEGAVKAVFRP